MGNSVARVDGSGDHPLLAVVGHVDEIALLVSHITRQGLPARRRLRRLGSAGAGRPARGGAHPHGHRRGVVGRKPIHVLEADERKKAVELKGLHVDIGVRDGDEARTLVREGDPIVITAEPRRAARRPAGLALAGQPPRHLRRARGRPPRERGRRRRRPGGGRGRGPGGDRLARRPRDGLRAAARPGRGGRRDPRHRRAGRRRRRAGRARARQRAGDHARGGRQPPAQRPARRGRRVGRHRVPRPRPPAAPPTPTPTWST